MAALAGLAATLLILWMPVGLVEMVVASSGLSEAVPAAAPPLGFKARLLMAGFVGLMAVGLVGLANRENGLLALENRSTSHDGKGRAHRAQGAHKMGFAFSKLTALARGRAGSDMEPVVPALRRADAHPDAPSRPPIFASRDFDGLDIFPRADSARSEMGRTENGRRPLVVDRDPPRDSAGDSVVPLGSLAMPSAPPPLKDEDLPQPAFLRPAGPFAAPTLVRDDVADDAAPVAAFAADPVLAATARTEPLAPQPAPAPQAPEIILPVSQSTAPMPEPTFAPEQIAEPVRPLPLPSTHGLSITQLTDRLERGLSQRSRSYAGPAKDDGVLADMPVASAVPVREAVDQDADAALRAALGTLRAMAGRR
ncbi:hypothetical protein [Sphingobium sp.]|uniref:hypothetical protein n=1 Tax=Sphingobium sp. TaxID=1912891 RepID=UPI003B3BA110